MIILPYGTEYESRRRPVVTYSLIGLNFLFFVITLFLGTERREITFMQFGFIPEEWQRVYTFVTSMFLHAGWMHIAGNMYFLWLFGRDVEDKLGPAKYILLYGSAGIAGSILHSVTIPGFYSDLPCIGASGAISGVLGAYMVVVPSTQVNCVYLWVFFIRPLFGKFRLPAVVFLGGWFLGQLIYGMSLSGAAGAVGVAFWAHIGGFAFGASGAGGIGFARQCARLFDAWLRGREARRAFQAARRNDWREAMRVLERLKGRGQPRAEHDILIARACLQTGETEKAGEIAGDIIRDSKVNRDHTHTVNAYYAMPDAQKENKLKLHDYLVVGRSLSRYGKTRHAIAVLLEAMKRFPDDTEGDLALYELGDVYQRAGRFNLSEEIYALFLELHPQSKLYGSAEYCLKELKQRTGST